LATVYGVVKQSGGYIGVESEKGKGASFKVYLPRVEQAAAIPEGNSAALPSARGSETILLVEDAAPLLKLAHMFLKESGYNVLTAANGTEALEVARDHVGPIHLLLTDVVMPGMNGRVLAERLTPRQPGMKVVYMSGYTDSFIAGHGVLEAGTHLIHKPFTAEVLTQKVRELLDTKKEAADLTSVPILTGANVSSKR
jgi:DNA-binding NtrC family response regulator